MTLYGRQRKREQGNDIEGEGRRFTGARDTTSSASCSYTASVKLVAVCALAMGCLHP